MGFACQTLYPLGYLTHPEVHVFSHLFLFYFYECMYMCQEHAGSRGAQKRASDTLELELQGAGGHPLGVGNAT